MIDIIQFYRDAWKRKGTFARDWRLFNIFSYKLGLFV